VTDTSIYCGFLTKVLFVLQCYNYLQLVRMDAPFTAATGPTHLLASRITYSAVLRPLFASSSQVTAYMHCRRNSCSSCPDLPTHYYSQPHSLRNFSTQLSCAVWSLVVHSPRLVSSVTHPTLSNNCPNTH
jgi:hypothetical protein